MAHLLKLNQIINEVKRQLSPRQIEPGALVRKDSALSEDILFAQEWLNDIIKNYQKIPRKIPSPEDETIANHYIEKISKNNEYKAILSLSLISEFTKIQPQAQTQEQNKKEILLGEIETKIIEMNVRPSIVPQTSDNNPTINPANENIPPRVVLEPSSAEWSSKTVFPPEWSQKPAINDIGNNSNISSSSSKNLDIKKNVEEAYIQFNEQLKFLMDKTRGNTEVEKEINQIKQAAINIGILDNGNNAPIRFSSPQHGLDTLKNFILKINSLLDQSENHNIKMQTIHHNPNNNGVVGSPLHNVDIKKDVEDAYDLFNNKLETLIDRALKNPKHKNFTKEIKQIQEEANKIGILDNGNYAPIKFRSPQEGLNTINNFILKIDNLLTQIEAPHIEKQTKHALSTPQQNNFTAFKKRKTTPETDVNIANSQIKTDVFSKEVEDKLKNTFENAIYPKGKYACISDNGKYIIRSIDQIKGIQKEHDVTVSPNKVSASLIKDGNREDHKRIAEVMFNAYLLSGNKVEDMKFSDNINSYPAMKGKLDELIQAKLSSQENVSISPIG